MSLHGLKRGGWDAAAALAGLGRSDVRLSDEEIAKLEGFFWFDLCAEYDAEHLHRHAAARCAGFSEAFKRYEYVWWRDEINHYRGFEALYRLLYGVTSEEIRERLAERTPDFGPIEKFFEDEFKLTVLFAYDELATTRAYHEDFELYRRMGPPFLAWIKRVTRDESFHFQNAVHVLKTLHRDRLGEVPDCVREFIDHDLGPHRYGATFLFDHDWDYIEKDFFVETGEILLGHLGSPGTSRDAAV